MPFLDEVLDVSFVYKAAIQRVATSTAGISERTPFVSDIYFGVRSRFKCGTTKNRKT